MNKFVQKGISPRLPGKTIQSQPSAHASPCCPHRLTLPNSFNLIKAKQVQKCAFQFPWNSKSIPYHLGLHLGAQKIVWLHKAEKVNFIQIYQGNKKGRFTLRIECTCETHKTKILLLKRQGTNSNMFSTYCMHWFFYHTNNIHQNNELEKPNNLLRKQTHPL